MAGFFQKRAYRYAPNQLPRLATHLDLAKNIVGSWSFANGTVHDLGPHARHGTKKSTVSMPMTRHGRAALQSTSAVAAPIDIGSIEANHPLAFGGGQLSVFCLIKTDSYPAGSGRLVDKADGGSGANGYSILFRNDGILRVHVNGSGNAADSTASLVLDEWMAIGVVIDGTSVTHYINGIDVTNDGTMGSTIPTATANLAFLGWNANTTNRLNAYLPFIHFWDRPLSAAENLRLARDPFKLYERRVFVPTAPVGGITVTPNPVTAVGATVAPTVIKGNLTLTPSVSTAVGTSVAPTVVFGSITISGVVASAVGAVVAPVVLTSGDLVVIPSAITSVGATVDPTVVLGSLTLTPTVASAVQAAVDPTVIEGALVVTPTASSVIGAVNGPTVALGSTSVTPTPGSAIGVTIDPTVDDSTGLQEVTATEDKFAPSQRYQFRGLFSEVIYSKQLVTTLSISNNSAKIINFSVQGAELGDVVMVSTDGDPSSITWTAYVTAENEVELTVANNSGATKDLSNTTWVVYVMKHVRV